MTWKETEGDKIRRYNCTGLLFLMENCTVIEYVSHMIWHVGHSFGEHINNDYGFPYPCRIVYQWMRMALILILACIVFLRVCINSDYAALPELYLWARWSLNRRHKILHVISSSFLPTAHDHSFSSFSH